MYNAPGVPREITTKVLDVPKAEGHQFVAFHVRDEHFAEEFLFMNRNPKFALDQRVQDRSPYPNQLITF